MSKVRVYEVAKHLNLEPKAVVALFQTLGVTDVRNHMSSVDADAVERVKRHLEKQKTHDLVEERIRPTVVKRRSIRMLVSAILCSCPGDPDRSPLQDGVVGSASATICRLTSTGSGLQHPCHTNCSSSPPSLISYEIQ